MPEVENAPRFSKAMIDFLKGVDTHVDRDQDFVKTVGQILWDNGLHSPEDLKGVECKELLVPSQLGSIRRPSSVAQSSVLMLRPSLPLSPVLPMVTKLLVFCSLP